MKFNNTFLILIVATFAIINVKEANAQTPAPPTTKSNTNSAMHDMPKCIMTCAQKVASSKKINCSGGLTDTTCVCPKKDKIEKETMKCAKKSKEKDCKKFLKDKKEIEKSKKMFEDMCKGKTKKAKSNNGISTNATTAGSTSSNTSSPASTSSTTQQSGESGPGVDSTTSNTPGATSNDVQSGSAFPPGSPQSGVKVEGEDGQHTSDASSDHSIAKGTTILSALLAGAVALL